MTSDGEDDAGERLRRERRRVLRGALLSGLALGVSPRLVGCTARRRGVIVGLPSAPAGPLPYVTVEEFANSILSNVYEPLVEVDGDLALQPALAESWHTPDDHTWVFTLRSAVALHDGRVLDAAMVAASITRARDDPASKRRAEIAAVKGIATPGPRTLVLRTERALGSLPSRLASIPIAVLPPRSGAPLAGTGPYRIRRWTPGGDVLLEAFPAYRGGAPPVPELEFRVVADREERVARLRRRELDLLFDLPPSDIAALASAPGIRTLKTHGLRVLFLGLRCAARLPSGGPNPLHDLRVRRAVALAIDRQALVRGPLAGTAEVIDQIIAPGVLGHDERLPSTPFDRAGAERLLASAGVEGFALDLDFMPAKYRAMDAVVGALAADLGAVGIRVTPRPWEPAAFFDRIERRQTSSYLLGWMSTNGDAGLSYEYLLHTPGGGFGVDNGGEWSDPELDRLLSEASARLSATDRGKALAAVAGLVQKTVPVVPLYSQNELYALASDLQFRPRLDRRIRGLDLRWDR